MKSIKKFAQFIDIPASQERSETDWVSLRNNRAYIVSENVPFRSSTSNAVFFDYDAILPEKLFTGSKIDSKAVLLEDVNEKIVKLNTPLLLDVFKDGSCTAVYPLDGNANDLSGNYNGVWSSNEQYGTGIYDQAALFDGNSYINTGYKTQTLIDNGSFSLWVKANPTDNDSHVEFFGYRGAANRGSLSLYWYKDDDKLDLVSSGGDDYKSITYNGINTIIDNWVHICGVYRDGTQTLYINGVKIGTDVLGSSGTDNYDIFIGWANINSKLVGSIDQVRFFNKPLTDDEVKILYCERSKKYDISNYGFSNPVDVVYRGSDLKMTIGASNAYESISNRLRKFFLIDKANSDISANAVSVYGKLDNELVIGVDDNLVPLNVLSTIDTINTLDITNDGSCIAVYTFDNEDAKDLSGNYDGTWYGNEKYTDGVFGGKAADFDGNSYILSGLSTVATGKASISFWMKVPVYPTEQTCAWNFSTDNGNTLSFWLKDGSHDVPFITVNNEVSFVFSDVEKADSLVDKIKNGEWVHLIITSDGRLYGNGELIGTDLFPEVDTSTLNKRLVLGADIDDDNGNSTYNDFFAGQLDQVRIFNKIVSEEEALDLYHEQRDVIDISAVDLDSLPKYVYLPHNELVAPVEIDDNTITFVTYPRIPKTGKLLLDTEIVNIVSNEIEETVDTYDPLGDNSGIALYTFDDLTANDASGVYNGAWSGTEDYIDGVFGGYSAIFDGVSSIKIANSAIVSNKSFTISVYVNSEYTESRKTIIGESNDNAYYGFEFGIQDDILYWKSIGSDGSDIFSISHKLDAKELSNWIHLAVTVDENNFRLYKNNELVLENNNFDLVTTNDGVSTFIGKFSNRSSYEFPFEGKLDQVRFFNRPLTADEIKLIRNEGKQKIKVNNRPESFSSVKLIVEPKNLAIVEFTLEDVYPEDYESPIPGIKVLFEDYLDYDGFRTVQRGLIIDEPDIMLGVPIISSAKRRPS